MDRNIFGFATLIAALLSFAAPAEARRGVIWIPTSGTGLAVFIGILVLIILIGAAMKLMRKGANVVAEQSRSISREAGTLAHDAAMARENTSSSWADKLGTKIEAQASTRDRVAAAPSAGRASPVSRPVRTTGMASGARASFGKRG